ncbi:MAG: UxaA family hydrolase [Actinomycetales bacterium]
MSAPPVLAIVLDPTDSVAVALTPLVPGQTIATPGGEIIVAEPIPAGHKVALRRIGVDEDVFKYAEPIGHATADIGVGEHVHVHNLVGNRLGVAT